MKMKMNKTATELSWEADRKTRKGWGDIRPTTQVIPNKKKRMNNRQRQIYKVGQNIAL